MPIPPRATVVGGGGITKTLPGHAAVTTPRPPEPEPEPAATGEGHEWFRGPASATGPAPPEAAAWLNSLLKPDASASAAPPAPVALLAPVEPVALLAPVEPVALLAPVEPVAAVAPVEPVAAAELSPPVVPPAPPEVFEAVASSPPVPLTPTLSPPSGERESVSTTLSPPAGESESVPAAVDAAPAVVPATLDEDSTALMVPTGRGRRTAAVVVLGAVAGLALAFVFMGRRPHASAPPSAPPPVEAVAPATPAPVLEPASQRHPEIALDPAGAPTRALPSAPKQDATAAAPRPARRPRALAQNDADETPSATPSGARPATQRGNALLLSGDASGAVAAFQEAVRLAPNDAGGYRGLGLAYEKQHKTPEAMEAYQHFLKLAHSSRERQLVARRLYHLAHPADGATP